MSNDKIDLSRYPTYDVSSLRQAIVNCERNIARMEEAIEKETEQRVELKFLLSQCIERDRLLQKLREQGD
jgi:hypothetical protein